MTPHEVRHAPVAVSHLYGAQGTAVVLQLFATAEAMDEGGRAFAAMDPSDTPGTRVSVDMCEVKLERTLT